ncbi:MAG TPA: hypothetical protein VFV94_06755 [Polyangiaceae bacterium]|jgi:hypothetical protein|nr:hypothetical protein [Polyangiaceae bacterium]
MHARFALLAGSALALVFAMHCAKSTKPAEVAPVSPPFDAGTDAGEGGAGGAADATPERPRPDPALVQKALDRTGTPTANDESAHGLRFEVVEVGPEKTWALAVVNRGSEPMTVAFDPRLLTLEVAPPPDPKAKKPVKPRVCRLPDELRPTRADAAYTVSLAPGHGLVEAFDPRLYCMPQGGVSPFVAGAEISAELGWPVKTKTVWQRGKRVEEVLPQTPPFVARVEPPAEASDAGADSGGADAPATAGADAGGEIVMTDTTDAGASRPHDEGVKELHSTPFALGNDYAPPPPPPAAGLAFEVTQGSDAQREATATVTVKLSNHGSTAADVYFRRELVTLEVSSVDGVQTCDPGPDDRSPDRQAFTHLAPGRSISVTSRLAEMCAQETFARPGLYLVGGSFDGVVSGAEFGFDAFVGHLDAPKSVTVRVRTGTLPFPGERALEEVQVGVAPQH